MKRKRRDKEEAERICKEKRSDEERSEVIRNRQREEAGRRKILQPEPTIFLTNCLCKNDRFDYFMMYPFCWGP